MRRGLPLRGSRKKGGSASRSIPTSTARSVQSFSQSVINSARARLCGQLHNSPIRAARSRSESNWTRRSSALGAGPDVDGRIVAAGALAVYLLADAIPRIVSGIDMWPALGVPSGPSLSSTRGT